MIYAAAYVLRGDEGHLENAGVRVKDGRITHVDTLNELRVAFPGEEIVDYGLAAIAPGFVNGHSHLEYSCMNGIIKDVPYSSWKGYALQLSAQMSDDDWRDAALMGALDGIKAGITATGDATATGASLDALLATGMHGVVYREVSTPNKKDVAAQMDAALEDVSDWTARAEKGSLIQIGLAPTSLYATHPEVLSAIADAASDGKPILVHIAGSKEEADFIRYGSSPFALAARGPAAEAYEGVQSQAFLPMGCSPVRYALNWGILYASNVCAVHCIHVDDDDLSRLHDNGVRVVVCPRSNAKLGNGVANVVRMREAGLTVGLGTNSPAAADSIDMLEEMRFSLLIERASAGYLKSNVFMSAREVMAMGTIDSARALGLDAEIGSLEPGKRADLCVIDLSKSHQVPTHAPNASVVHTTTRHDVLMTMIDGRQVWSKRDGFALDIDVDELNSRITQIRRKLRD
jgi:5-methylthioadenosine/S-adenosylhomocysteine deaminase